MKKAALLFAIVAGVATFVNADTLIRLKSHSDAFTIMGQTQPARDDTQEIWIGQNQMATITKEGTFIVDLGRNVLNIVDHSRKSYVEMTLPFDMKDYLPPQMAQMIGATKVTVTPKGTTQQVNQWNCNGYDVVMDMGMMKIKSVIWASTDVPFDWAQFFERFGKHFMKASMRVNDDAVAEYGKIQGFQVKADTVIDMMGAEMKASSVVTEISEKPAPPGIYSVPAGYTRQDKLITIPGQ
ncbi:MAG TPA: DUF4412 domain-containing protein [Acidobacteriota bacterium]|nr:DUF4412 domain-containing protein [Acidobacteriota bacterium]